MQIKLNGWQRIWLLLTALWLAFGINFYIDSYHSAWYGKVNRYVLDSGASIALTDNFKKAEYKIPKGFVRAPLLLDEIYPSLSKSERIDIVYDKFEKHKNQEEYKKHFNALSTIKESNKKQLINRVLSEWKEVITPPLLVYLFGWCVAWIRRGFSKKL
jgi:hypothetical protein